MKTKVARLDWEMAAELIPQAWTQVEMPEVLVFQLGHKTKASRLGWEIEGEADLPDGRFNGK